MKQLFQVDSSNCQRTSTKIKQFCPICILQVNHIPKDTILVDMLTFRHKELCVHFEKNEQFDNHLMEKIEKVIHAAAVECNMKEKDKPESTLLTLEQLCIALCAVFNVDIFLEKKLLGNTIMTVCCR